MEEKNKILTKKQAEKNPEAVEKNVNEGYKTPEELIFKKEFDKQLYWINKQINLSLTLTIGVTIVFFIGFIAAIIAYFQMVQVSFNDYKTTVNQFNNERIIQLENRVQQLETKEASRSAK